MRLVCETVRMWSSTWHAVSAVMILKLRWHYDYARDFKYRSYQYIGPIISQFSLKKDGYFGHIHVHLVTIEHLCTIILEYTKFIEFNF